MYFLKLEHLLENCGNICTIIHMSLSTIHIRLQLAYNMQKYIRGAKKLEQVYPLASLLMVKSVLNLVSQETADNTTI